MGEDPEEEENKEKMLKLTGFADSILSRSGNMEIYEETYEGILFKIKAEEKKIKPKTAIPEDIDEDDALDMFADSLDDKSESTKEKTDTKKIGLSDDVMWEFKWKE